VGVTLGALPGQGTGDGKAEDGGRATGDGQEVLSAGHARLPTASVSQQPAVVYAWPVPRQCNHPPERPILADTWVDRG
jgi:hypothetical protein